MSSHSLAVAFLRRRTTFRAFKFYLEWVRRAVGLTTLVYLLGWFGVFLVSGLQLLSPLSKPLVFPLPVAVSVVLALFLLAPLVRSRVPPVTLNRRDLLRLGLAPVSPWLALRWPFAQRWLLRAAVGIVLGLAWWVLARTWFFVQTPWSALALGLVAVTQLNFQWLRYAGGLERRFLVLGVVSVALAFVGVAVPQIGLGAAFYGAGAESLLVPAALALVSSRFVYATLKEKYPPKFAAQSFVLGELNTIRTLNTLAAASGTSSGVSGGERARLLEQLHGGQGARTPRRALPPPVAAPAWRALAWRTNLTFLRRSRWQNAVTVVQLGFAGLALAFVEQSLLVLLLNVVLTGSVVSRLVGPPVGLLPISQRTRTLGRAVSGTVVASLVFALTLGGGVLIGFVSWAELGAAVTLPPLVLVALEKYATGLSVSPERFEVWFVVTLLALSPLFVLSVAGFAWLALPVQLGLALLLLELPV